MIETRQRTFTHVRAGTPMVRDFDFGVARGEIFGFLGPKPLGKSTTQNVLIRLLEVCAGEVRVLDKDRATWAARGYHRRRVRGQTEMEQGRLDRGRLSEDASS